MEYKYDGVGRLIGRKDADGKQIFVQSGWNIMTEQDTEGRRTYYTGSSAVKDNSSDRTYFLFNHRGDTVLVSDQSGSILNELYYEAYGKVTNQTGTPINPTLSSSLPPLFVGAYGIRYDRKTELSYMRFRWYNSGFCRFLNSDVLQQLNKYSYTVNNPIVYIDILGQKELNTQIRIDNIHNRYTRPEDYDWYNLLTNDGLASISPYGSQITAIKDKIVTFQTVGISYKFKMIESMAWVIKSNGIEIFFGSDGSIGLFTFKDKSVPCKSVEQGWSAALHQSFGAIIMQRGSDTLDQYAGNSESYNLSIPEVMPVGVSAFGSTGGPSTSGGISFSAGVGVEFSRMEMETTRVEVIKPIGSLLHDSYLGYVDLYHFLLNINKK
ncbi:MAG: hypothetical protein LWY06_16255 [Firmicutes bacterium]|nr:hypothetical protein [Bacillota bacterium]